MRTDGICIVLTRLFRTIRFRAGNTRRGCGEIGRRARFRFLCPKDVEVQLLSAALILAALILPEGGVIA